MKDPIVDEIRNYRMEHTKQFDSDLHLICADLREFEKTLGDRVVELKPNQLESTKASSARGKPRR